MEDSRKRSTSRRRIGTKSSTVVAEPMETEYERANRSPMPVFVKKEIGIVDYGEGYKLVGPDGKDRNLSDVEAALILVAGWDEPGEFHFTTHDGFKYEVVVDRVDRNRQQDDLYADMSRSELVALQKRLYRLQTEKETNVPGEV